ncbi:MAG TPA: MarR family winged helix-turn-helix transcriptional regulator [Streptosporangiaceae bacterium]|nr:MarR family winged helix-turn-helix transcriptional regulator [Streptosporangiaceae bacterium]
MTPGPSEALASRLGYLLKHAQQRLVEAAEPVMAEYGIDGRELAVLTVLAADYPLSQQEAAERLGVDRTTMVALVDDLEAKGLVRRHRSLEDRRKNIVQLTEAGEHCLDGAGRARNEVEREYLAPLGDKLGQQFLRALQILAGVRPG